MTITIRNKKIEELLQRIGQRTGEHPDVVIERLVRDEAERNGPPVPEAEVKRRLARMDQLRKTFPPPSDLRPWREVEAEMDSIFGEDLR